MLDVRESPVTDTARRTPLRAASPCFIVADFARAVRFYQTQLGFELRYSAPDEAPFFGIVGRDQVQIHLKEVAPEIQPIPNAGRHAYAPFDAFVEVADPDQLAAELRERGVQFHVELSDRDDSLRGFQIRDCDGYVLFFGRVKH